MAEYVQEDYFGENVDKYIDIHNSICVSIESLLATLIFRKDFSRIVYSTPENAFRTRMRLMDASNKDFDVLDKNSLKSENLNLPFASYCKTGEFEDDDRIAAVNASQSIIGDYIESAGQYIRSLATKSTYKAVIYVSTQKNVRMVAQLLHWDQSPKQPIWVQHTVNWHGERLNIPCNITIENVDTNPSYEEKDFLEQARIFPINVEFTVRSYQILIPNIDHIINLPIRWGNKYSPETFESQEDAAENTFIVQESILIWANQKWKFETPKERLNLEDPHVIENANLFFSNKQYTKEQLEEMCGLLPNYETNDIIEGYWSESYECAVNKLRVDVATPTSLTIKCVIKQADHKYFDYMDVFIPGHDSIKITDPTQSLIQIDGLVSRSTYDLKFVTHSKQGVLTTYTLQASTTEAPDDPAPNPAAGKTFKRGNSLIGLQF